MFCIVIFENSEKQKLENGIFKEYLNRIQTFQFVLLQLRIFV